MLSWNLAEKREGTTWVCGRVSVDERELENRRRKRSKTEQGEAALTEEDDEDSDDESVKETLEVWLQLVEVGLRCIALSYSSKLTFHFTTAPFLHPDSVPHLPPLLRQPRSASRLIRSRLLPTPASRIFQPTASPPSPCSNSLIPPRRPGQAQATARVGRARLARLAPTRRSRPFFGSINPIPRSCRFHFSAPFGAHRHPAAGSSHPCASRSAYPFPRLFHFRRHRAPSLARLGTGSSSSPRYSHPRRVLRRSAPTRSLLLRGPQLGSGDTRQRSRPAVDFRP